MHYLVVTPASQQTGGRAQSVGSTVNELSHTLETKGRVLVAQLSHTLEAKGGVLWYYYHTHTFTQRVECWWYYYHTDIGNKG